MKKIRTLVVDDEPLARARIVKLLDKFDYIELVGEGKNGREALRMIQDYQPDLVFLDIQMPDFNGFEVLARSTRTTLPFIIFVTAYDQYALKAFDVHAVDYLLKPYDDERFIKALDHAIQQISMKKDSLLHNKMMRLLQDYNQHPNYSLQTIEIKEKGINHTINIDDVQYFETHGNYVKIHLQSNTHLIRQTLQNLLDQIQADYFLRIHRSLLVNTHYVTQITYKGNNQYLFVLKNKHELFSSRGYKSLVQQYLTERKLKNKL